MHRVRRNLGKQAQMPSKTTGSRFRSTDEYASIDFMSSKQSSKSKEIRTAENLRRDYQKSETLSENGACSSISTIGSNESGILDDIGETIDEFIEELDNLEWSLSHHQNMENRESANSVDISTLLQRMRCTVDEETKQSKEFIDSVKSWRHSEDVQMVKTLSKEEEEQRIRREWFQKRFSRRHNPEKSSSTVSERIKKRKERLRGNNT